VVNAAGPAAHAIATAILGKQPWKTPASVMTLAMNLGFGETRHTVAFTLTGADGRQLFAVPWRGRMFVGTAHVPYAGDPAKIELPHSEAATFLAQVNAAWPGSPLEQAHVRVVQAGLVPGKPAAGAHTATPDSEPEVDDHARDGEPALITATSVKFTTARAVARQVTGIVCRKLGASSVCSTAHTPLPGAPAESVTDLLAAARRAHSGVDHAVIDHLVRSYGRRYGEVMQLASANPALLQPVAPGTPVVAAQFAYAIAAEMAHTVDDLILRRTEIGAVGAGTPAVREFAAFALRGGADS